jgi:glycerophosphoryl diester phosphodiesterase
MDMEIKEEGIEDAVVNAIQKNHAVDKSMVSSFIYSSIKKVYDIDSSIQTAAIMGKLPEDIEKCLDLLFDDVNTRSMMIGKKIATGPFVREVRRRGFKVGIWNADTAEEIEQYAYMEPYYLCSNYPGLLVEYKHVPVHI